MKYVIGTNNPRKYGYHESSDFEVWYFSTGDYFQLVLKDGTFYKINGVNGLTTHIHGRVASSKGGMIQITYTSYDGTGDAVINYIQDTMGRKVFFQYGLRGSKPTIIGFTVKDWNDRADPYSRIESYTIGSDRLLTSAVFSGDNDAGPVSRDWKYGYVAKQLVVNSGKGASSVFLIKEITNPDGGKVQIDNSTTGYHYHVTTFYLDATNWIQRALAAGVRTYTNTADLLNSVEYTYTTAVFNNMTFISFTGENSIDRIKNKAKITRYTHTPRTKYDPNGYPTVATLLSITETYDPLVSISNYLERVETYYYDGIYDSAERIKKQQVIRAIDQNIITQFAYDTWGNVTWRKEYIKSGAWENSLITWIQYADLTNSPYTSYSPPQAKGFEEDDANWNEVSWVFSDLLQPSEGPKPHNIPWRMIVKNYYPTITNGIVTNFGGNTLSFTQYKYDSERRRIGEAEWDGGQWYVASYTYHADERLATVTTPIDSSKNHVTAYDYDDFPDNMYIKTATELNVENAAGMNPVNIVIKTGYEKMSGWVKWKKNANGYVTEYAYDALGRPVKIVLPDDDDEVNWVPDGSSPQFRAGNPFYLFQYNDASRWIEVTYPIVYPKPVGRKERTYYNNYEKVIKEEAFLYDGSEYQPEAITDYEYDGWFLLIKITDPVNREENNTPLRPVTGYEYDALGETTKIIYPDANYILYRYDYDTNVLHITNERGFESEEQRDMEGRIVRRTDFGRSSNRETRYYYDGLGNQRIMVEPDDTDPVGRVTVSHYDMLNQLVKVESPEDDFYENDDVGTSYSVCSLRI